MDILPMVDMRLTPKESQDTYIPTPLDQPAYPYGLCISLCDDELEKLGLSIDDLSKGDMIHLHCMGVVTSTSETQRMSGEDSCRVEIQITHISCKDEDEENEEEDLKERPSLKTITSKLYKD